MFLLCKRHLKENYVNTNTCTDISRFHSSHFILGRCTLIVFQIQNNVIFILANKLWFWMCNWFPLWGQSSSYLDYCILLNILFILKLIFFCMYTKLISFTRSGEGIFLVIFTLFVMNWQHPLNLPHWPPRLNNWRHLLDHQLRLHGVICG